VRSGRSNSELCDGERNGEVNGQEEQGLELELHLAVMVLEYLLAPSEATAEEQTPQ
jgi:hypothetical protein